MKGGECVGSQDRPVKISRFKFAEPIVFSANQAKNTHLINYFLTILDQKPGNTKYSVYKPENPNLQLSLTKNDVLLPQFEGDLYYKEDQSDYKCDDLELLSIDIPRSCTPTQFQEMIFRDNEQYRSGYDVGIMLHYFLSLCFEYMFIGQHSPATQSVLYHLDTTKSKIFAPEVISAAISSSFTKLFVGTVVEREDGNVIMTREWERAVFILADLITNHMISRKALCEAVMSFAPSALSELFIQTFTKRLMQICPESEVFELLSSIFSDYKIIRCFSNTSSLTKFLMENNYLEILPYPTIYAYINSYIENRMTAEFLVTVFKSLGLKSLCASKRIVKVVLFPLLRHIFTSILSTSIPMNALTQRQMDETINFLNRTKPILLETISIYSRIELHVLFTLLKYLSKRRFEPKGISLVIYSFLYKESIISSSVFGYWIANLDYNKTEGINALVLEIGMPLLSKIPGPHVNSLLKVDKTQSDQEKQPLPVSKPAKK